METKAMAPDRIELTPQLSISRILTGLWQVADQEKAGHALNADAAAEALLDYARAGFDTFDMADHYGSAELLAGQMLRTAPAELSPRAFTKWCPQPAAMTAEVVRAGVEERRQRLGVQSIDLLQFHWWSFQHSAWLDALHELTRLREEGLIKEIGVTNFDAAHLHLALEEGIPIVSNQVSFSLVDRRAAGPLSTVCREHNVRLLAYGSLCGGFLSERWLDQAQPTDVADWSRMKYARFIDSAGGWEAFQSILCAAHQVALRHDVSIANVATRWVLEHQSVAAVIVGARLGENQHRDDNARVFSFKLDAKDNAELDAAFAGTRAIAGDCGDEYRQPPFLTASGDLSHHLSAIPTTLSVTADERYPDRLRAFSGSKWEPIAGYCRAIREGNRIYVSGTTATHGVDHLVAPGSAAAQTTYVLDKIASAITALGGEVSDVLKTNMYLKNAEDIEGAALAHGRFFSDHPPANTSFLAGSLIGDFRVEIDAEVAIRTAAG